MLRSQLTLPNLLALGSASAIAIYGWLYLNADSTSNCGGNSAALAQVAMITETLQLWTLESANGKFALIAVSAEQRDELVRYASNNWIGDARYFVTSTPIDRNSSQRRVVVFCDHPYDNVPRYTLGKAPPTHAVGYSDGSTGLLTVEQFKQLDRTSFVALELIEQTELAPSN
jgi:hypothetical protein